MVRASSAESMPLSSRRWVDPLRPWLSAVRKEARPWSRNRAAVAPFWEALRIAAPSAPACLVRVMSSAWPSYWAAPGQWSRPRPGSWSP